MTMSRRKNSDSVSLFPFLAVLLCTMGVLIVLLVVLAKQAKLQAASTTPTETISIEDFAAAQRQVEDLEKGREESLKRLNEGGLLLSNLEDHIQRMQKQLEEFRDTVAHLHEARALSDQELKKARAEVERLNRLIDENRKKLQAAREEAAKHAASYAIIPYQGPYQTFRRPIFIECLDRDRRRVAPAFHRVPGRQCGHPTRRSHPRIERPRRSP